MYKELLNQRLKELEEAERKAIKTAKTVSWAVNVSILGLIAINYAIEKKRNKNNEGA